MRKRVVRGITAVLCAALLAPAGAVMMPGGGIVAEATDSKGNAGANDREEAIADLKAYKISLRPNTAQATRIDEIIKKATEKINKTSGDDALISIQEIKAYVDVVKSDMDRVVNPPEDDDDDDDDTTPSDPDHFLMVGGNWVTPTANAGQTVSIVLPVVNMGKTMVNDAVVTPVLSTDATVWPFEITNSNYTQTIKDLPGTDTGASDMDRRREGAGKNCERIDTVYGK